MRKYRIMSLVLAMILAVTSGMRAEAGEFAKKEYNLVFIPKLVHEWYEEVKVGIEQAIADLAKEGVKVNYTWDAPSDAIVTEQIAKMEAAAANQPDGISIAIIDPSATNAVINEMVDAGINVSTFDCDAPDSKRLYYCGHADNFGDGKEMARRLAAALGEKGEVAVLAGSLSASNHQDRVNGFLEEIKKFPNITVVDSKADEDSIEVALAVSEGYITAYPNLSAIYGVNAASPIGAARAVVDAGKRGKILVIGYAEDQEAMNYVKDGAIFCTLRQAVPTYGYNSVFNMLRIADGKAPKVVNDDIPAHFVTSANIADYLK